MNNVDHLLNLARRGGHRGSSGGEKQAHAIVKSLFQNFIGLDGNAQSGIRELVMRFEQNPWDTRNQILDLMDFDSEQTQ